MKRFTDFINEDELDEAKIVTKVNSKGQKRKKRICGKGKKLDGNSCVPISGSEKNTKRIASRKAVRTKKAKGAGAAKKVALKRNKAMRRRKSFGL